MLKLEERTTGTLPTDRQTGTLSIDKPENELNHTLRKTEYSIKLIIHIKRNIYMNYR